MTVSENHQLIHQDSGRVEWYTPAGIIEAARAAMGGIELDPASSAAANETVRAERFFTEADDGLVRPWAGRVWLNPPFSANGRFIRHIVADYRAGRVTAACVMTFASLDTAWARMLAAYPRWYPAGRVSYLRPDGSAGGAPPKASMVTYLGTAVDRFVTEFTGRLGGWVDVPWEWHERDVAEMTAAALGMNMYRRKETES